MCAAVVLRGLVPPDDARGDADERRAHLGHSQELRRCCLPATLLRQGHHIRLVDYWSPGGVVVIFDLGEWFPRPRSQQRGTLRPRARRVAVLGVGVGQG